MPILIKCPGCEKQLRAKDDFGGRRIKCPSCGQVMTLPTTTAGAGVPAADERVRALVQKLGGQVEVEGGLVAMVNLYQSDVPSLSDAVLKDLVAQLAGLTALRKLLLHDKPIKQGGRPRLTDVGIKELAVLRTLYKIDLSENPLTDAALKELAQLKDLRELHLTGTRVTDGGLTHLTGLGSLKELYLARTAITDTGLQELARVKSLELVNLFDTRVTARGATTLRQALPSCKVLAD